jgi:hypothetical protein
LEAKHCYELADGTDLPITQYGREVLTSTSVHPHSIFSSMDSSAVVDILGSTKLRSKQKSTVRKSPLSDHVADVCGVPCMWTGPKLEPNWKAYNATLEHAVKPVESFPPSLMKEAGDDWLEPLLPLVDASVAPLTDKESIMGKPGVKFLDALPMSTSMGFPLFGKKSKFFEDVWVDGQLIDRVPSDDVVAEHKRLMESWKRGERGYPVTSATLKDEPTQMVKNEDGQWVQPDKVRVFQCSAVAMSLWIRKYFLPVSRFLALHPIESECALGLNCMSPQWKDMVDYAWQFCDDNEDAIFALDYSKYDVRMNSQLTHFVWSCLIRLAEKSPSYTSEDIRIMKMMVTDIVHPLIDWNGTLIRLCSMNTSGHNLTVHINSGGNSVLTRMGFKTIIPKAPKFREAVAASTYGDDLTGSVKKQYRAFNFSSYKEFLSRYGMKITLPSKTDEVKEFLSKEEADFLKRRSVFIPEIGFELGALDEDSIFKSLHSNLKSSAQTPREVAVSCVETAIHEWFAHGRDVYEMRRTQMEEVCKRASLPVPQVHLSFEDQIDHWKQQHKKT